MKFVQFIVYFTNGDTLKSVVMNLEDGLREAQKEQPEATIEQVEHSIEKFIELLDHIKTMDRFTFEVPSASNKGNNKVSINTDNVNYVEVIIK